MGGLLFTILWSSASDGGASFTSFSFCYYILKSSPFSATKQEKHHYSTLIGSGLSLSLTSIYRYRELSILADF